MANKDLAIFLKKLQAFYSNNSNNGKIPKVNTTTGAIDAIDPASFAASGASGSLGTYIVTSTANLPLAGMTKGALGLVPVGSNYEMYAWGSNSATGTLADWKKITSTSVSVPAYAGTGFVYGATTSTPIDAAVGNSFDGVSYSAGGSVVGNYIELTENGVVYQEEPTTATRFTVPNGSTLHVSVDFISEIYIPTQVETTAQGTIYVGMGEGAVADDGPANNLFSTVGVKLDYNNGASNATMSPIILNGATLALPRGKTYRFEQRYDLELTYNTNVFKARINMMVFDADNGNQYAVGDFNGTGTDYIKDTLVYQPISDMYPTATNSAGLVDINPRFFIRTDTTNNNSTDILAKVKRFVVSRNW